MKERKKLISVFLAIAMVFAMMPFQLTEAEATTAVTGNFGYSSTLKDTDGKAYTFPSREMRYMQIYLSNYSTRTLSATGSAIEIQTLKGYRVNGKVAYCFEHGVVTNTAANLVAHKLDDSIIEQIYVNSGKEYVMYNMGLCLYYGRQENSNISDLLDNPSSGGLGFRQWRSTQSNLNATTYNLNDWEAATRQLVHESQQMMRNENFNLTENGLHYESAWHGKRQGNISKYHYISAIKDQAAYDIYRYMVYLIKTHRKFASQIKGSRTNPKVISVSDDDGDGVWKSDKIYISKNDAFELRVAKTSGESFKDITIELYNKDTKPYYVLSYKGEPKTDKIFEIKKAVQGKNKEIGNMLIWECKDGNGGHVQALATGSADPVSAFVKFATETEPTPTPDGEKPHPEFFPGIEIPLSKVDLNPGFDGNVNTPMGDATLGATYVLLKDGVEVDRATLDDYGSTATLMDLPVSSVEELDEVDSGQRVHTLPSGDVHCTVEPTTTTWSKTVTYTVREIRPDGRFVEPDSGQRTYTFTYTAETNDSRTCTDSPESWSDISYNITLANNSGLGANTAAGTIDEVLGKEPIAAAEETFVNDCYRGKITLSKSLENEDVFSEDGGGLSGGQKDSVKSLWTIRLDSGGFENHPYVRYVKEAALTDGTAVYKVVRDNSGVGSEDEPMKIGTNGDMVVYDLPYGEYTVSEVSADDDSYVLESFKVKIDEHGQTYTPAGDNDNRYDYNIRDKKKTNVIKVVKTNAETGKQVISSGTKFYIRYMGNPLLDDPTLSKNYGRLLPNAQSITKDGPYTWETDRNGEIAIPYELEYGIYRLEEWSLPEGYFVGEYDESGKASSHDYKTVEEGQRTALDGSKFDDIVSIYDSAGNKVEYKDKSEYRINEVFNYYTFKVEKQETHIDGNFGQLVTSDGTISMADPSYDADAYPYINYYKAVAMANNNVKGRIKLYKEGQVLIGFKEVKENGKTVMKPVYSNNALKGAVFGIYAAEDIRLNDGTDTPKAYDSETEEEIEIPLTKSTHSGNPVEDVISALSKFFTGRASVYDTGELNHSSGAKLWYLNERFPSEEGKNKTIYVSPEKKDTTYQTTFTVNEDGLSKTYKAEVKMNYQAGGKNVTNVKVTKTTAAESGYMVSIPLTVPKGSVGNRLMDPIENYILYTSADDPSDFSALTVSDAIYTYEAKGKEGTDQDGNTVDFGNIGVKRYIEKDYVPYKLTAGDLTDEERETAPGVKETKKAFEWENSCTLVSPGEGGNAVMLIDGEHYLKTTGYYQAGVKTEAVKNIPCDGGGNIKNTFTVPGGYDLIPFTENITEATHYIMARKTVNAQIEYVTLLEDGNWQQCDSDGNFLKSVTQVYEATYVQQSYTEDGFTFTWDGFEVSSAADKTIKEAVTKITRPNAAAAPDIEVGAGYTVENDDLTATFTAKEPKAPIFFMDGLTKIEMYYAGGVMKTVLTIPQSEVKKDYEHIVPTLKITKEDKIVNWYSSLSPANPVATGNPVPGVSWTATRHESKGSGEAESYTLVIISDQTKDYPMEISFADGYTFTLYADNAENGNGVGVMEVSGINKTTRFSKSDLVDTITTDEHGFAESKNLPLGKYVIRELKAPAGYVADTTKEIEVELIYKDQFTPVVWSDASSKNDFISVEIDLEKVFETAFGSGAYTNGGGAVFGIYNRDEIAYAGGSLKKDTLIGAFTVNAQGKALYDSKLPEGIYYVKELSTRAGYIINDTPFYFSVSDNPGEGLKKEYINDGVFVAVTMESYGKANMKIRTEERYPAAELVIDGKIYSLDEKISDKNLNISFTSESSMAELTLSDGKSANITLPNGKKLSVSVTGNTYSYEIDGEEGSYIPQVIATGYYASYEILEDEKNPKDQQLSFTAAGGSAVIELKTTHEEEKLKLSAKPSGGNVIEALVSDGKKQTVLSGSEYTFEKGNTLSVKFDDGTHFAVFSDAKGNITISCDNILNLAINEENKPYLVLDGHTVTDIDFSKSITIARQDSTAERVMIKINSIDNVNASGIKNKADNVPYTPEPYVPTEPGEGSLEISKTDVATGKPLANAGFRVYDSAKNIIREGYTDSKGIARFDELPLGTYYYQEFDAPDGYVIDESLFEFTISTGGEVVKAAMTNTPEKPDTPDEPGAPDSPDKPVRPDRKPDKDIPKTGENQNIMRFLLLLFMSSAGTVWMMKRREKKK